MKHDYELVWVSEDMEGFRCKNCGKEVLDIMKVDEFFNEFRKEVNKNEGLFREESKDILGLDFCDWLDLFLMYMNWQSNVDCDDKYYERIKE